MDYVSHFLIAPRRVHRGSLSLSLSLSSLSLSLSLSSLSLSLRLATSPPSPFSLPSPYWYHTYLSPPTRAPTLLGSENKVNHRLWCPATTVIVVVVVVAWPLQRLAVWFVHPDDPVVPHSDKGMEHERPGRWPWIAERSNCEH